MQVRHLALFGVLVLTITVLALLLRGPLLPPEPDNDAEAVPVQARPTLYWGSRGDAVRQAQERLARWGYYDGAIDGVFGAGTHAAVRLFQRRNGLQVDGVIGPRTWEALGLPTTTGRVPARGASRQDDLWLLAQAVSAEARGEPFEGQVAVAAVILNRVESGSFPDTLAGVIYQPLAFESVANGTLYRQPTEQAIRAARAALNGWDPTGGALYFWNPAKATSQWIWSRNIASRIGDHVFAH